jgi:hypothetical protein
MGTITVKQEPAITQLNDSQRRTKPAEELQYYRRTTTGVVSSAGGKPKPVTNKKKEVKTGRESLSRFQQPTQNQTDDIKPTVKKTTKLRSIR